MTSWQLIMDDVMGRQILLRFLLLRGQNSTIILGNRYVHFLSSRCLCFKPRSTFSVQLYLYELCILVFNNMVFSWKLGNTSTRRQSMVHAITC